MKNIVITGGSDGLGKALATQLTKAGHQVVILAPNSQKIGAVAQEIGCSFQVCDVTDWQQVDKSVSEAHKTLGSIDVLINNAGVTYVGRIEDMKPEDIQHTFDVNVVGVLFVTKAVVPFMKQVGDGCIINVNSQAGLYTKPERALYGGSKWAITGITRVLQAELAPSGIKVTGLYPGAMEQTMSKDGEREPQRNSFPYQDMADAVEFIISRSPGTVIPELGIKNLAN